MAGYTFEDITDQEAASFSANDFLLFNNGETASDIRVAPFTSQSGVLSGSGITLSFGNIQHTFNNDVSAASIAGHLLFNDNSHLLIGTQSTTGDMITPATTSGQGNSTTGNPDPQTVYALSGNDTIDFSTTAANVANLLNGGFGADTIMGGAGSNHIYGNSVFAQQGDTQNGQADGTDTITVTTGSNYINGNAGADTITAGTASTTTGSGASASTTAASTGFNRIFGGADNDTINILGNGHNAVNGNTGNDSITDSGMGDNTLRGGQGNDIITGGSGHSVLMGDVGNDTIVIHAVEGTMATGSGVNHIDLITGGDGSDLFNFSAAGAATGATFGQQTYYQEITDYMQGTDHLEINTAVTSNEVGTSSTVFTNVHDAELYAQTQVGGTGGAQNSFTVSSLAVGSANNTYLFYADSSSTDPSTNGVQGLGIIHLDNVVASSISYTDFVTGTTGG